MGSSARTAIAALLGSLWSACGGGHEAPPRPFEVVRTSPELGAEARLYLNQAITVFFAEPIDPLSVTADSVQVLDAAGHSVPGRLRVSSHAISFVPEAPLQPDLTDGTLLPDAVYELRLLGYPNADGVAAADGRMLAANFHRTFRTLPRDTAPLSLPSPLLAIGTANLPFLLMPVTGGSLAAGNPRLRLHFTLPVLPTSLCPEAFAVQRFRFGPGGRHEIVEVLPRSVRLLSDPRDAHPGSTVELDLGGEIARRDGAGVCRLQPDDIVVVDLAVGDPALRDYAGRTVQMPPGVASQSFGVVAGGDLPLWEWPAGALGLGDGDGLLPGFEILPDRTLRPQVRVEAGDGSLGEFRPQQSLVLRADAPFDRGDGRQLVGRGGEFAFLSIDIPAGVEVRVETTGTPLRLLACGSVRIAGSLVISAPTFEVRTHSRPFEYVPMPALREAAPVQLLCGGNLQVLGSITADRAIPPGHTACALIAGGRIERRGPIPAGTILAVEPGSGEARLRGIDDPQALKVCTSLQPGLPPGARLTVSGTTPWVRMPDDQAGARLELANWPQALGVGVQQAAPDPLRPEAPDPQAERWSSVRRLGNGAELSFPQGCFLRFLIQADLGHGQPLPTGRRLLLWRR